MAVAERERRIHQRLFGGLLDAWPQIKTSVMSEEGLAGMAALTGDCGSCCTIPCRSCD